MNPSFPKTLIQIHYHNRPAGVSRVMTHYTRAFQRLQGSGAAQCILICHAKDSNGSDCGAEIVSHRACDYHAFRSKAGFLKIKKSLIRAIEKVIFRPDLPKPVAVIGHNLTLGKNGALSAAFAELAASNAGRGQILFYSVVHDMAEEGRSTLMRNLHILESAGVAVWKYIYPVENVRYFVLNKRNYALFRNAGFSVSLLPNPIESTGTGPKLTAGLRAIIHNGLRRCAAEDDSLFLPDAAVFFYPVRVIARKNVLEAIIVSCLLHKACLLVGASGRSSRDKALFGQIKKLARKYDVAVLLGVERLKKYLPSSILRDRSLFSVLYSYCDCCVTTSIGEGFGYALCEPWLYDKNVIGRLPKGIAADELKLDLSHLYSSFPIPVQWINLERLYTYYIRQLVMAFGKKYSSLSFKPFRRMMVKKGCVDFGALYQGMQFEVAERLFRMFADYANTKVVPRGLPREVAAWFKELSLSPRRISQARIHKNRQRVSRVCVDEAFDEMFRKSLNTAVPGQKEQSVDIARFITYFSSLENFRLLMNPGQ